MVAHPLFTYLTNAGVRWLSGDYGHKMAPSSLVGEERWAAMREGAALFRDLLNAPIPRIAVENPVMHKYAVADIGRRQDQTLQPWQFSDPVHKAVGLWLVGLPPLLPTGPFMEERHQLVHMMAPSPDRSHKRSVFFPGIAAAMAAQWGSLDPASRGAPNPNGTPPVTGTNRAVGHAASVLHEASDIVPPASSGASLTLGLCP